MKQFDKITKQPPELRGRLNSFIVTEFDDSMTVEMQLRVLIKWIMKNIDLTNEMVDYLNKFIEEFDGKLYSTVEKILIKWLEDGIFQELILDIILLIGKLDDFRPQDKSLIEKIKNEFGERGINITWFGIKSGDFIDKTVNEIIQTFWTKETGLHLYFPSGHFFVENMILIDKDYIKIEGSGKTLLEFRQTDNTINAAETAVLGVGKQDTETTRINVDGIHLTKGIQPCEIKVVGILLNVGNKQGLAITDSVFRNMRVFNMDVGLKAQFMWGIEFDNIRFQNSVRPLQTDSQCNNILYNRVSFVSFTQPMSFINNEGIQFNSCEVANFEGQYAMWLYHSSVTFINPYFENISKNGNSELCRIGSYNDLVSSSLEIIGGKVTDKVNKIVHSSANPFIFTLTNNQGGSIVLEPVTVNEAEKSVINDFVFKQSYTSVIRKDYVTDFDGTKDVTYEKAWGGNPGEFTQAFDEKTGQKTISYGGDSNTPQGLLVKGFIKDEYYTVIYSVDEDRKLIFRNGGKPTGLLKSYDGKVNYLLTKAGSDVMRFEVVGGNTVHLNKLVIVKGIKFPPV